MTELTDLFSLVETISDREPITLHAERCLNGRFRALDCSLCADTCPAEGAITVVDGKPSLNNNLCLQCGLCLHRCPTDAFTRKDRLSGKLAQLVRALPAGEVDLLCPQHQHPDRGPAEIAVQTQRCLAALSPATLLALSMSDHKIRLDDSNCSECPLVYVHTFIEETVARSNDWIEILPGTPFIRLHAEEDEEPTTVEKRPVYNPAMSPVSRRKLFSAFKTAGKEALSPQEKMEMVKSGRAVPVSERLPQTLPRQHAQIVSLVERRAAVGIPLSTPAAFTLSIDEVRCTACTLCAKFCPTGALDFATEGESFDLTIQPSLCLGQDCNICVIACPEQAVSIPAMTEGHDLLARSSLVVGQLTACRQCKQPIREGTDLPDTCFACGTQRGLDGITGPVGCRN